MALTLTVEQIVAARDPNTYANTDFITALPTLIQLADAETSSTLYGDKRNLAIALLVLHWEFMRRRDGASTQIIDVGDGPSKRGFARPNKGDLQSRDLTSWGVELDDLSQKYRFAARNRMVC